MFEYYSMKVRNGDLKMGAGVIRFAGRYRSIICCLVLILSTALAYSRIAGNDFVNYDDPYQVTQEDHVLGGLTWENILWSFGPEARCSPLTWMAYAAGHSLFGLNPGMFHIMSLVIHIAGSVLLFSSPKNDRQVLGERLRGRVVRLPPSMSSPSHGLPS